MYLSLYLLLFAHIIDVNRILGQKVSLQYASASVALGESFQFICRITESGSLTGLLYTNRGTPSRTICTVNSGDCSQFSNTNGYSCGCVDRQTGVYFTNISSVKLVDGGVNWVCQYGGVRSNRVTMNVIYPPTITAVQSSINVTENTSLNIDCSSNITPSNPSSTSYRWTGPGGYSKTGAVLDRTVTRTQAGQYTCTATNTAGLSYTAAVNINIHYPPAITLDPDNKDVPENTTVNIDCSSDITPGNPSSTSYRWTGPGGYSKTGAVLDRTVTRTQAGQYTCTATNTAGLSYTAAVNINIHYPPAITLDPDNKDVPENTTVNIDCSSDITPGNPSSTSYRWTGPGGYSKTGAVLDRTVTRTQAGQYTCTATNTAGMSDTTTVKIGVLYLDPPEMSISPTEMSENGGAQLFCKVTSKPTVIMTIRNLDNNTNLVDQELTNSRNYVIERAQCLHNGTFQCLVDNKETNQTKTVSAALNVLCSPRRDDRKVENSNFNRNINETATMFVNVIANPPPAFTWWKYVDGQRERISERTIYRIQSTELQSTLQITVTHASDYGQYAAHVENEAGDLLLIYSLSANPTNRVEKSFDDWLGVGVGIGVFILVLLILLCMCVFIRERRRRMQLKTDERYDHLQHSNDYDSIDSRIIEETELQDLDTRGATREEDVASSTPIQETDAGTLESYLTPFHHGDSNTVKKGCNDAATNSTNVRRDSCTSQTFQKQT